MQTGDSLQTVMHLLTAETQQSNTHSTVKADRNAAQSIDMVLHAGAHSKVLFNSRYYHLILLFDRPILTV